MSVPQLADVVFGFTNVAFAGLFHWLGTGPFWFTIPAGIGLFLLVIALFWILVQLVDVVGWNLYRFAQKLYK